MDTFVNSAHFGLFEEDNESLLDHKQFLSVDSQKRFVHRIPTTTNHSTTSNHSNSHDCHKHTEDKTEHKLELLKFEDLPSFLQGNEYLQTGYRANLSWSMCLISIFRRHNESLNIWTHGVGTLIFMALAFCVLGLNWWIKNPTTVDKVVFFIYFLGAISQMLFSTIFHTFCCRSLQSYSWFARLDYTGICLMAVGSYFPPIYYMFQCNPSFYQFHLSVILALGIVGIIVSMTPFFQAPRFRSGRAVFFILFAMYIFVPLPQMINLYGLEYVWPLLWRILAMGTVYFVGASIYASRCPECCAPGKFDMNWWSHPIWHVFSIVAALMQFSNCLYVYQQHLTFTCPLG
eukprot:TRINITY_DN108_c0_g2_i2.p1 TRINITY_DN108_c0_g2~~TRINITY_DN108_c0_g2_i2.p1  ORF type:complete len:345 (-),score=22.82 TRINITY_DN108_c0_g2_i2:133-1167(-)